MFCQGLQVLHDVCEVELVACAGEAPQPHTLKTMVGLQVRKIPATTSSASIQIGLVLLIVPSAKNAILIVESRELRSRGETPLTSVVNAARARFRPVLINSLRRVFSRTASRVSAAMAGRELVRRPFASPRPRPFPPSALRPTALPAAWHDAGHGGRRARPQALLRCAPPYAVEDS
jgi:hypothetical protein